MSFNYVMMILVFYLSTPTQLDFMMLLHKLSVLSRVSVCGHAFKMCMNTLNTDYKINS